MIYERLPSTPVQRGDIAPEHYPVVGWPLDVFFALGGEKTYVSNMLESLHQRDDRLGRVQSDQAGGLAQSCMRIIQPGLCILTSCGPWRKRSTPCHAHGGLFEPICYYEKIYVGLSLGGATRFGV